MAKVPVAIVLGVSRWKVGDHPGCDTATFTFTFDSTVYEWVVRANSTDHLDGVFVAQGTGRRRGFGRQRFGRTAFGRFEAMPGAVTPTVEVRREDLLHGPNEITVYARGTKDGPWSQRPPSPVAQPA